MSSADRPRAQGTARPVFAPQSLNGHSRRRKPDETHFVTLGLDPFARLTLALLRWHFLGFAQAHNHGWLVALRVATAHVGPKHAGILCYDIVNIVQCLRMARKTPIAFNPEGCACCRVWLTPDERRLMEVISQLRRQRIPQARLPAQLLCDGMINDTLLECCQHYVDQHAPPIPGTLPANLNKGEIR